jgi:hypothetical protein
MRLVAVLLAFALFTAPLAARADIVGPPGDPARKEKIIGITVADVGAAFLVGGIIMLAVGGATDPETDQVLKRDLYLAGGLTTTVGACAIGIGLAVWMLARKQTAEWIKNGKPAPATRPGQVSLAPGGLRLTF